MPNSLKRLVASQDELLDGLENEDGFRFHDAGSSSSSSSSRSHNVQDLFRSPGAVAAASSLPAAAPTAMATDEHDGASLPQRNSPRQPLVQMLYPSTPHP